MSDSEERFEALQQKLQDTLEGIVSEDGSMMTKWVAIVEAVEIESGERQLLVCANKDAMAWDTLGLLKFAENEELAGTIEDRLAP